MLWMYCKRLEVHHLPSLSTTLLWI